MAVQRVYVSGQIAPFSPGAGKTEALTELLRAGVLCNEAMAEEGAKAKILGDPVDTALLRAAEQAELNIGEERAAHPKIDEIPFSSERKMMTTIAGSVFRTLVAYSLIFWVGLEWGGLTYARTMLFTSIVLHAFTRVLVVRQLDDLSLWSNPALLWSYAATVGLQLLALYTPLREFFGVVPLDGRAWGVMVSVLIASSLAGIYMTRWILKRVPLWEA